MTHKEIIQKLKKERFWTVRERGRSLELAKSVNGRMVIVALLYQPKTRKYTLVFPSYVFQSAISHFGPVTEEVRFCRNKSMLFSLIRMLKRSAIWKYLDNQTFLTINVHNSRSDKGDLKQQLKGIYDYKPREEDA